MLRRLNHLLFVLLLVTTTLYAADARLNDYPQTKEWLEEADTEGYAAFNIGVIYHKNIKDYDKAIEWYEKAYSMSDKDSAANAASNLGYLFDDLKQYDKAVIWYERASTAGVKEGAFNLALLYDETLREKEKAITYYNRAYELGDGTAPINIAIVYKNDFNNYSKAVEWYKKAYEMGNIEGANGLAYLCENTLHDDICAEEWYLKAAKGNERKALGNLAKFYLKKGDNVKAGAYAIALIDNGFTKEKIFGYLDKWKLSQDQIKQAYELQKTLDIPKHYTGGIE